MAMNWRRFRMFYTFGHNQQFIDSLCIQTQRLHFPVVIIVLYCLHQQLRGQFHWNEIFDPYSVIQSNSLKSSTKNKYEFVNVVT